MKASHHKLADLFVGFASKELSPVEADSGASNQHEFNGVSVLRDLLGSAKKKIPTDFLYLSDNEDEVVQSQAFLTWYDARESHPIRTEYRLYFPTTEVSRLAKAGDQLFIALRPDGTALAIIAAGGSTSESQLNWLFSMEENRSSGFQLSRPDQQLELGLAGNQVVETLGYELGEDEPSDLDELLDLYGGEFPSTAVFSAFARDKLKNPRDFSSKDDLLVAWLEKEEQLFRTLEKHKVAERLRNGFRVGDDIDVEGFIKYSLSVQNRRKSRAGYALENHLEHIFMSVAVTFNRNSKTENNSSPDFLFPGIEAYNNPAFSADNLAMLGVKTSCKERWRQVLAEAAKIERKHLFTLEPAISINQTNEMQANNVQLVLPKEIHQTYRASQRDYLFSLQDFIDHVELRQ